MTALPILDNVISVAVQASTAMFRLNARIRGGIYASFTEMSTAGL